MDKVRRLRAELPATEHEVYLNTGSVGPMPRVAAEATKNQLELETSEGRVGGAIWQAADEARQRARAAVAGVIGADAAEIALTHFTTESINVVLWGLDWRPGDEILITSIEHPAIVLPAQAVAQRYGAAVKVAELGYGGGDVLGAFERALSERTRLLALSHVAYCTGAALPLAEIVRLAQEHDILTLVDGAQSAGAIPVDVAEMGVDFYAVPGQKWLLGPEDTGALYVRRDRLDQLRQTFVGYMSVAPQPQGAGAVPHLNARRYEVGSRNTPSILGQAAAVEWLRDEVGLGWAQQRIRSLLARAREALGGIPGVSVLTPANCAGLLSFAVGDVDPDVVTQKLSAQKIVIRSVKSPRCNRASFGFFNTEEEIEQLAQAVSRLLQG